VLFELKPVTFRYKRNIDPLQTLSFGLIAEEVAQISPDLVTPDKEGKPQTVRYEAINAMLLNEFLKEHKKVEEQQSAIAELRSTIARQEKGIEVLAAQLKEQAAQIQKVSAQVEMHKMAPQVAINR
jgi:septal ring factor EnvC (AmiA/AmiB activator)